MIQTPAGAYLALLPEPVKAALVDLVQSTSSVTDDEVVDLLRWIDGMHASISAATSTPAQAFIGGTLARVGVLAGAVARARRADAEEVI